MKKKKQPIYESDCDKYTICDDLMHKVEQLCDDFRLVMYVCLFAIYLTLVIEII